MVRFQQMGITRLFIQLISGRASDYERLALPGNLGTAQTSLMLPQIFHLPHYAVRILYGLPEQTEANFLVSARFCCKYHAPEIIFSRFTVPSGAAWQALPVSQSPMPALQEAQSIPHAAREHLLEKGYIEYLPDHFALPGFASRHELALSGKEDFLSFGPGTISRTDGIACQTTPVLSRYIACADQPEKLYTVIHA